MLSRYEVQRSIAGAWQLARGDMRGLDLFDVSVEGFWRSFGAAFLVAPAYAILLVEQYTRAGWPQQPAWTALAQAVTYLSGWTAFPLAAILLTRLLGLTARYVPLIVANNWASVVQAALYTLLVVLSGFLSTEPRATLLFTATIAALIYQWFVIRTALGTTSGTALGLVVIDVLLSVLVSRGINGLLQPA